MSRATRGALCLLVTLFVLSAASFAQSKQYVILAKSQGKGSTDFAANVNAAGGTIIANLDKIGVVVATATRDDFAANVAALPGVQAVAEDAEINFINNENAVVAD